MKTQESIDYARSFYRLEIERMEQERAREDKPSALMGALMLAGLCVAFAVILFAATRCDANAAPALSPETTELQSALDTQCLTGTREQRLACAIDVVQGHGHPMTPQEQVRAKRAASMLAKERG